MTAKNRIFLFFIILVMIPLTAPGESLTGEVWNATRGTFVEGELRYRRFDVTIAPGMGNTLKTSRELGVGSLEDLRDTVVKSPETLKIIYKTGILQNCAQYKALLVKNWNYSKLSLSDFADARDVYLREGNWGILQSVYYGLKGTCRVVWALAILNSGEALYQIGKAGTQTVYYLVRYPVSGIAKGVATPVVFAGGSTWSLGASAITTGWALPVTATIDAACYAGDAVWPDE